MMSRYMLLISSTRLLKYAPGVKWCLLFCDLYNIGKMVFIDKLKRQQYDYAYVRILFFFQLLFLFLHWYSISKIIFIFFFLLKRKYYCMYSFSNLSQMGRYMLSIRSNRRRNKKQNSTFIHHNIFPSITNTFFDSLIAMLVVYMLPINAYVF